MIPRRRAPALSILVVAMVAFSFGEYGCRRLWRDPSPEYFSCFDPGPSGAPFLDRKISVSYSGLTVEEVVRHLHRMNKLPVSYIETTSADAGSRMLEGVTVRRVLRELVGARPGYVCRVIGGHVMLYPDLPDFERVVRGVDITRRYRSAATQLYVDQARRGVPFFRDVYAFLGGNLMSPAFSECVSLDRDAKVIVHLSQLLGKDRSVFLVSQQAPVGGPELGIGNVGNRAMWLAHPRRPPLPNDCEEP
jgi:hypothetical protein